MTTELPPSPSLTTQLQLVSRWTKDRLRFVRWGRASSDLIFSAFIRLRTLLRPLLSCRCLHTKGNGGVKGAIRWLTRQLPKFRFVARVDIASYYNSINHAVLEEILRRLPQIDNELKGLVSQFLQVPDRRQTGVGMVAGSCLSPLLGALYLLPLDQAMEPSATRGQIFYVRYMDDIIILAKTRHHLRSALRKMFAVLKILKLKIHSRQKRFIGKISKGFDFLGYWFQPERKLQPSAECLRRHRTRIRRLYEQGADSRRLRQYVDAWLRWLHAGLRYLVTPTSIQISNITSSTSPTPF